MARRDDTDVRGRRRRTAVRRRYTRLRWRILGGLVGSAAMLALPGLIHRSDLAAAWSASTADSVGHPWPLYAGASGILFGGALVLGIVAALLDRSAARAALLAAGLAAVALFAVRVHGARSPEAVQAWSVPGQMVAAALNPTPDVASNEAEEAELEELKRQVEEVEAAKQTAETDRAAAQKAAENAKTREQAVQEDLLQLQQELARKVDKAEILAEERTAARYQGEIFARDEQIEELKTQLDAARRRVEDMEAAAEGAPDAPPDAEPSQPAAEQPSPEEAPPEAGEPDAENLEPPGGP